MEGIYSITLYFQSSLRWLFSVQSSQVQELKKLKQKHSQITSKLQETISSLEVMSCNIKWCEWIKNALQMKLGDEQAFLYEIKRQQLRVLDEQQKVYAEDLSR